MIFTQTEQQKLSLIKKNLPVASFISTTLRRCFPSKTTPLLEMKKLHIFIRDARAGHFSPANSDNLAADAPAHAF